MEETYPLIEEESHKKMRTDTAQKEGGCPMYFGVRSYLHHFYDKSPSPDLHTNFCEQCGDDTRKKHSKYGIRFICKALIWLGINLMLIGLILLVVGTFIPKRSIVVGIHDHLEKIDRSALSYNKILDNCHLIGLYFFIAGSSLLLVFLMIYHAIISYDEEKEEASICRLKCLHEPEEKIPADEKITRIQPESLEIPNAF